MLGNSLLPNTFTIVQYEYDNGFFDIIKYYWYAFRLIFFI